MNRSKELELLIRTLAATITMYHCIMYTHKYVALSYRKPGFIFITFLFCFNDVNTHIFIHTLIGFMVSTSTVAEKGNRGLVPFPEIFFPWAVPSWCSVHKLFSKWCY